MAAGAHQCRFAVDASGNHIRVGTVLVVESRATSLEVVDTRVELPPASIGSMIVIGNRISHSIVLEYVSILYLILLLKFVEQFLGRYVLGVRERDIVIPLQLDSDRIIAQSVQPVPHAHAGVVCPVLGIQNLVDCAISGNEVVRVPSESQEAAAPYFAP